MAVKPRIAIEDAILIQHLPIHADAIVAATIIEVGDLLRYESDGTATASGVAVFDTATEDSKWIGCSKGKTTTDMISGAYGDTVPVVKRGIIKVTLTSADYNYGEALGWASDNTLAAATIYSGANPVIAWFIGSDADSITSGLVYFDTTMVVTGAIAGGGTTLTTSIFANPSA